MLESLPQKTECSKGAESALNPPENKTLQRETAWFSLERLLLLGGQAERPKKELERHWDFGNATSRAKDSTYVTDD